MGVVREIEEDVVGLDETRHRLDRTSWRRGIARERKMEEEMVVGGRREGRRRTRKNAVYGPAIPI